MAVIAASSAPALRHDIAAFRWIGSSKLPLSEALGQAGDLGQQISARSR